MYLANPHEPFLHTATQLTMHIFWHVRPGPNWRHVEADISVLRSRNCSCNAIYPQYLRDRLVNRDRRIVHPGLWYTGFHSFWQRSFCHESRTSGVSNLKRSNYKANGSVQTYREWTDWKVQRRCLERHLLAFKVEAFPSLLARGSSGCLLCAFTFLYSNKLHTSWAIFWLGTALNHRKFASSKRRGLTATLYGVWSRFRFR